MPLTPAVRLRPIQRAEGGGGGCPRKTACKKKRRYFGQKGPNPPLSAPWESKHWNEYTKPYITEHSWQRKKIRGTSKSKTSLDWWDVGLVVQKARKQGTVC